MLLWCSKPKGRGSIPGWAAGSLLRWFQSGRNRLGRMKKVWLFSNWPGGVMVKAAVHQAQGGRGSTPSWPKSSFKLVSEWKKKD